MERAREPIGKRLLRALVLPFAFAVVATLLLLFTPSGRQMTGWLDDQLRVEESRGRIIDATTGAGVAGATVVIHSLTDKWKPSIVGEISHGVATTDADGGFVIRYQRLAHSRISARAPGYATIFRVPLGEEDVVLPTSPAAPGGEVEHRPEVGFDLPDSSSVVYFDLARDTVVSTVDEADFEFRIWIGDLRVNMRGLGQAGLAIAGLPAVANSFDPLAAECLAPEQNYLAMLGGLGGSSNFTAFARLRDGNRYCRIKVRIYGRGPTPMEGYRVEIERWFNPTGGRNVCEVPVEGEENEFAPVERAK